MLTPKVNHLEGMELGMGTISYAHRSYNRWRAKHKPGKNPVEYGNFYRMLMKKHKDAWPHLERAINVRKRLAAKKALKLIESGKLTLNGDTKNGN